MRQAQSLAGKDGHYRLRLSDGSVLTCRTVIIATGAAYQRLGIPHLEDLQGRGVFYGAAASEAPAMRGRTVFVAGGGNSAGQTALHMARWARQVTVLVRGQSLADSMSDYLIRQIDATPNVDVSYHVQVVDGTGTGHLQSLVLADTACGERRSVPADALFVLIGSQPRTEWLGRHIARDQEGFILTGPTCQAAPATAGPRAARRCRSRPACPECSPSATWPGIGQTGRLRRRRRRGDHPPGAPLPANRRPRTSHRGPVTPSPASNPRPGPSRGLVNVPTPSEHNVIATRQIRRPEMEQIMTGVSAQEPSFYSRVAAATVQHHAGTADDVQQHDHAAAAAYLMKHEGTTALIVVNAQTGQPGWHHHPGRRGPRHRGPKTQRRLGRCRDDLPPAITTMTSIRDAAKS